MTVIVPLHDVKLIDTGFGRMVDETRPCDSEPSAAGPSPGQAPARECAGALPSNTIDIAAAMAAKAKTEREARAAKRELADAMRAQFTCLRLEVSKIMLVMAEIGESLSPVEKAQAKAIGELAGLKLHRLSPNVVSDEDDARRIGQDIEATARILDKLFESMGRQLLVGFHGVDLKGFEAVVTRGIEDSCALIECEQAARRHEEENEDADF